MIDANDFNVIGAYQVRSRGGFYKCTDFERAVGYGDVAGDLVLGVPCVQALEEGCCYYPGREGVTRCGDAGGLSSLAEIMYRDIYR